MPHCLWAILAKLEDWTRRQDLNSNFQEKLGTEECIKWCQWDEISKMLHVDDSVEQRIHFSWETESAREGEFYRELAGILKNCSAWDWDPELVKTLTFMREYRHKFNPWVRKIPLEKKMATHSNILAWRIPWTKKPGRMQSTESQRVVPNWAATHTTTQGKTVLVRIMVMWGKNWVKRIDIAINSFITILYYCAHPSTDARCLKLALSLSCLGCDAYTFGDWRMKTPSPSLDLSTLLGGQVTQLASWIWLYFGSQGKLWASHVAQWVRNPPAMGRSPWEELTPVLFHGEFHGQEPG